MISGEFLAVFFGLSSALSWGAGDFSGGFATKRSSVFSVVILSQLVGALCLVSIGLWVKEPIFFAADMLFGSVAGIAGVIGLIALYRGLALGRMGVVAPLAAVITAVIPVCAGILAEGFPTIRQVAGFALALVAVWLLSRGSKQTGLQARDLSYAAVAGLGFGLFFILIDRVSEGAILWPLVGARTASIGLLIIFGAGTYLFKGGTGSTGRSAFNAPRLSQLAVISLAGIFDAGGNAFFALATQTGRLDISAVLSSLYPASTVILAWLILKEQLVNQQWLGVFAALIAVVLIAF